MLTLLSPSKTLDLSPAPEGLPTTQPHFEKDIEVLLKRCKKLSVRSLRKLMDLSEPLAELNYQRFQDMSLPFTPDNAKPAVLTFQGDVYKGLDAASLSGGDLEWAQDHLRIISGLYGLLRPLDLMQPYRLEMGRRLSNTRGKNLYQFWKNRLADSIDAELDSLSERPDAIVLNLASTEYSRAVPSKRLTHRMITAGFQEVRDGKPRTIGFLVKRARGLMARFVVKNRIEDPGGLKDFNGEGYAFRADLSDGDRYFFSR